MRVQATARARPRAESGRCCLAQAGVGSDQPGEIRGGSRGSGDAKDYEEVGNLSMFPAIDVIHLHPSH